MQVPSLSHLLFFSAWFFYIAIDCGNLQSPANGRVEFSSTSFRSVATYFCNEAFELVGDQTRFCQADGQWSRKAPTCQSKINKNFQFVLCKMRLL